MARQTYGKTWWGAQWLNALTQIDYENRLPRGRSYANKGAVNDLVVDDGVIQARVKGSRARPYRVMIKVPPIEGALLDSLLDQIAADPVLIARLLNRELDPALLDLANQQGVQVFPSGWKDLAMQCSCPDWAVPCKHLAAVIYRLSHEIDNNPFLVFSLRGIDLAQLLTLHNVQIEREAKAALPTVDEILLAADLARTCAGDDQSVCHDTQGSVDFSAIPVLLDVLLEVLPAQPAFFAGPDFRANYQRVLGRIAKQARRALDQVFSKGGDQILGGFQSADRPHIDIDAAYDVVLSGVSGTDQWPKLVSMLEALDPVCLPNLQPELAGLHSTRLMALHLLAAGAVTAQIFSYGEHDTGLRWLPALSDNHIQQQLQRLAACLPHGMIDYRKNVRTTEAVSCQAVAFCSLFLDYYIRQWSDVAKEKPLGDKTLALFFGCRRGRYDGPGESATPHAIQSWLARHHLSRHAYTPVLRLEESGDDCFSVDLLVATSSGAGSDVSSATNGNTSRDASGTTSGTGTEGPVPVPLSTVLSSPDWAVARFGILQDVTLLAEFFPALETYIRRRAHEPLLLPISDLPTLFAKSLPIIQLLGIRTVMPKVLERLLRPRLSLRLGTKKTSGASGFLKMEEMLSFDWKIAVGDHQLSRSQFESLVKSATGVVRFKGQYVLLDPHDIEQLRAQLDRPTQLSGNALLQTALAGEYQGTAITLTALARQRIRDLTEAGPPRLPNGINATLRPYQHTGYGWLYRNACAGFGSVIADDMGLGKTLQVICALQKLKEDCAPDSMRALVVVPTSLLTNWQREFARFAPGLCVAVFSGKEGDAPLDSHDIWLCSYGVVRRHAARLKAMPWQVLVVDEAQNIKNPAAAQTKAIKSIGAHSFIAMSGTPVENRLSEFWSIMDFANQGYLGSLAGFTKQYALPIQVDHNPQIASRFRRIVAPFLMRRLKTDKSIINDLPEKIEQDQYCTLAAKQAALYESVVQESLRVLHGESNTFKRQGLVLQMILALKQICNHPAQYLKQGDTSAALSGKAERVLELIDDIYAAHEKVLVFTQFTEMGKLLCQWIHDRHGRAPQFLHGRVSRGKRDAMVTQFQADPTERVFVLSLKAGGTGLNLTAATQVIHYDLWWNPAVEAQATDRAYRIGQHANVQVHRLLTRNTFEERINELIGSKRKLADLTVGTGEQWIGKLGESELRMLFSSDNDQTTRNDD